MLIKCPTYFFSFILLFSLKGFTQEIEFGSFSSAYSISIPYSGESLNFNNLIKNDGNVSIPINDGLVIPIEGTGYLDVLVTLQMNEGDYIYLDGDQSCENNSCRIPFTLKAAYFNREDIPNPSKSIIINGTPLNARFPIRHRGNNPPGPPPTPVYNGYDLTLYNKTAFIYVYGDLNVGSHNAGSYNNTITLTVSYD